MKIKIGQKQGSNLVKVYIEFGNMLYLLHTTSLYLHDNKIGINVKEDLYSFIMTTKYFTIQVKNCGNKFLVLSSYCY